MALCNLHRVAFQAALLLAVFALTAASPAYGDETCNSPYISKLIKGQEDYVYVWTLGVEGLGDGSDKLVTVDVNPKSKNFGKVIHQVSVKSRGEAHHMGFTDDRRQLWAGGLAGSEIYVFDIATNPARPKLVRTIIDLARRPAIIGPHTYYALPGRMLVQALSNDKDKGGVTGMALYNNKGGFITSYAMPTTNGGDGYGYDLAVNAEEERAAHVELHGIRELHAADRRAHQRQGSDEALRQHDGAVGPESDEAAKGLQRAGSAARNPLVAESPRQLGGDRVGADFEDLAGQAGRQPANGRRRKSPRSAIRRRFPLPVDISITRDGKGLWVNTFMDGMTRYFDLSNPEAPKQTYEKQTGKQVNMISQSWDGKRVYITSSLLANWDKAGADNEQFLRALQMGRQGAHAGLRGRFHEGEARPRAPHEARVERPAQRLSRAG